MNMQIESVTIRGRAFEVSVLEKPSGTPLLMLNGMRLQMDLYDPLRKLLPMTTIGFNFPLGWNVLLIPPSLDDIADSVVELVKALGYSSVDLLGTSWGGMLAIVIAHRHPQVVRKLILAATAANPSKLVSFTSLRSFLTKSYGGKMDENEYVFKAAKAIGEAHPITNLYRMQAIFWWSGEKILPQITQRTLVLWGSKDHVVLPQFSIDLREIPNSTIGVLPNDGHLFVWSSAVETAGEIKRFLR